MKNSTNRSDRESRRAPKSDLFRDLRATSPSRLSEIPLRARNSPPRAKEFLANIRPEIKARTIPA